MQLLIEIPNTGYNQKLINDSNLLKLWDKVQFKLIISHIIINAVDNYKELTKEEILDANTRKTKRPPLQKNTIYCYCELKRHNIDQGILPKLMELPEQPNEIKILINNLSYYESDYIFIDIPIYKDLKFEHNGKEVGWYNKRNNILWMSDIGHFPNKIIENFRLILTNIIVFNRTGNVPILPNLMIGCDLEFELYDRKGQYVPADKYLTDISDREHKTGLEIGLDGRAETGEIRPPATNNPIKLSRNIKRIVKRLVYKISSQNPDLQIYCGGGIYDSLGGHIHFNLENFDVHDIKLKHILYDLIGVHIKKGMGNKTERKIIDKYMGRDGDDVLRRAECHPGMEWRCLPSFMLNETICKAILCTTWCVVKEYYGHGFSKTEHMDSDVIETLTSLHLYPCYKTWIDQFIHMFISCRTAMEEKSIKKEWNIKTNSHNLIISSGIPWINEYFNSTYTDIPNTIRINIYSQQGELYIDTGYQISTYLLSEIQKFAEHYLIPFHMGTEDDPYSDIKIGIPWYNPPNAKIAFDTLKGLLKKIIIETNNKISEKNVPIIEDTNAT